MPEAFTEFCESRGGLAVLIVLDSEAQRFTDLKEQLHISQSTLTRRLGEARDLGLVTPEIDASETSVDGLYRLTERGKAIVKKSEELDLTYAYRTLLDLYQQIDEGTEELTEWLDDEEVLWELSRYDDTDPYVDPFGEDVTGYGEDETGDIDDEFFTRDSK